MTNRRAQHFADSNLFHTLFRRESGKGKQPQAGDNDSQNNKADKDFLETRFRRIHLRKVFVEKRIFIRYSRKSSLPEFFELGQRYRKISSCQFEGKVATCTRDHEETKRFDLIAERSEMK